MPQGDQGHAVASLQSLQSGEMEIGRGQKLHDGSSVLQPPEEQKVASKGAGSQRLRNKQSLDYVLRTGLAGGLAGCAVRIASVHLDNMTDQCPGQDSGGPSRSRQDPLPSLQPAVRKIYWQLVRRCDSHA